MHLGFYSRKCDTDKISLWFPRAFDEKTLRRVVKGLEMNPQITDLDLGSNQLLDDYIGPIMTALNKPKKVMVLKINNCDITERGAVFVARALGTLSTLTSLALHDNQIGDSGASLIANALERNRSLKTLNIDNNGIGNMGVTSMADVLHTNSTLTSLSLDGNDIGDEGARLIMAALESNCALTYLSLGASAAGDDEKRIIEEALRRNEFRRSLILTLQITGIEGDAVSLGCFNVGGQEVAQVDMDLSHALLKNLLREVAAQTSHSGEIHVMLPDGTLLSDNSDGSKRLSEILSLPPGTVV
eukprot:TRINITY_DN68615_c0_g1_i1.p1 TRINITY_DN68615_c0_g1~~TRINITY_DN68615_c0_g1_i1.p1  ORF type:complete len:331 (+),score=47.91 TRINITY_DN68615_c0_g1_i1:95-994(+)